MSQHFRTIPILPGPEGVFAALTAVHELFEDEQSVALIDPRVPGAAEAIRADTPLMGDEPSLILVTSGSTGAPRGVEISVSALGEAAALSAMFLSSQSVWLTALPVTSMGGLNTVVRSALAGTAPVIWDGVAGAETFTAESFEPFLVATLRSAKKQKLSAAVSLVPTQLHRLLVHSGATAALAEFDHVLIGGAATPPELLQQAEAAGVSVIRTYGATETCGGVVYNGIPLPEIDVRIDASGVVSIYGPTIATSYRDGELIGASGWKSSDVGSLDNGVLSIQGRVDDLIKTAGSFINLNSIVEILLHALPADAFGVSHAPSVEYGSVPVIAVTADHDVSFIENHIRENLAAHRIPLRIVNVDTIPLLANGKVDRRAIAQL